MVMNYLLRRLPYRLWGMAMVGFGAGRWQIERCEWSKRKPETELLQRSRWMGDRLATGAAIGFPKRADTGPSYYPAIGMTTVIACVARSPHLGPMR